ncbi:MAG: hypothetical protein H6661_05250 [Ardenticatenaceae bacterium]|nr:hypothetical protein [Ardenticatenaceae bacterium]
MTFYVTSKDVQHGFRINETNVNMQIVPGEVSKLTITFDEPREYDFICHEYCVSTSHLPQNHRRTYKVRKNKHVCARA